MVTRLRSHGVTLVELLVVLTLLGIVAMVAIPDFRSGEPQRLDLAAAEFAEAIRFARSEALRTGEPRGFRQKSSNKRLRVFSLDTSASPWVPVYDIYHPVSKKIYDIRLDEHPFAAADSVNRNRLFMGACNKPRNIWFDGAGIPRCTDPENVPLGQFDITLTLGPHTRVVTVDGITGRVRVQ